MQYEKLHFIAHPLVYSDYSTQDGAQSTDKIAEKASKLGMPAVALTDHGRAGGLLSFKKSCEKHEIRPIYGMEAYVAPFSRFDKKHEGYKPSSHMCLLAKNSKGLENLFKLTSLGWIEGQDPLRKYYNKPRIDLELIEKYKEGLIVTTGCGTGFIPQMIMHEDNKLDEAINRIKELQRIFKDDVYLEVQNHGLSWQEPLKKTLFELSKLYNIQIIATQDSHYTERADAELHRHICKLATGGGIEFEGDDSFFKSYDELASMFNKDELHALENTNEVADKCQAVWEFGKTIWPVYDLPKNITPNERLKEQTEEGFLALFPKPTKEYRDRLEFELNTISEMGFPTYFLVVAEFIEWAKNNGIPVGPGRGCLIGSTPVYTSFGDTVRLDSIKSGLPIISHTGKSRQVTNTFEYDIKETLLNIKTFYGEYNGLTMTKDHKVFGEKTELVNRSETWNDCTEKSRKKYKKAKGIVSEIPAVELKEKDYIFFPKIKRIIKDIDSISLRPFRDKEYLTLSRRQVKAYKKIEDYILKKYNSVEQWKEEYKENKTNIRTVNSIIQLDNDFMWILGKWIANGWLRKNNNRVWGICFNSNETEQIKKVKQWLNKNNLYYKQYGNPKKKLIQMEIYSGIFVKWWRNLFPRYKENPTKHFPELTRNISDQKLMHLIKGYIDGNGHVAKGKIKTTTVSKELAEELKYMLLSLNIPSSITVKNREDTREKFKNVLKAYYVSFPVIDIFAKFWPEHKTEKQYNYHRTEKGIFCRIRSIKEVENVKKVYDITVEEDSSYLTTSGAVHNSGAGSLVCYTLGITDVDPIKYGLYFERFLNPARVSLPDLDIDFCPKGRKKVIQHVIEKYGVEKCAQIGTYSEFKPRGSLRDFSRTLGYDKSIGAKLSAMIPPNQAGKSDSFDEVIVKVPEILKTDYPDVIKMARKAEKMKNKAGVHAAGVIISDKDLSTQLPLFRGKKDEIAAQFDMHDVEEIGLVKYDFLGLKNLSVIDETTKEIKNKLGLDIDWNKISKNDKNVFSKIFQSGRLDGIFQFENSGGFRDLCFKVKPISIDDLSSITALFRPGPLGSGLVSKYADCRQGTKVEYLFPKLKPILKDTYGIMIFQEQIMKICTDCAGYTLAEADNMRKIIGKKLRDKMKLEKDKLVSGCVENGIDKNKANELFKQIKDFAQYSFNKAHSVAYSIISYRTAWLKHYYPVEFYTALMNNADKSKDQGIKYIHACREDGVPILPPDVNISQLEFTNDNGTLIFGLSGIKGIGVKGGCELLKKRNEAGGKFSSLEEIIKTKIKKTTLIALAESGALEELTDLSREQLVQNIETLINYYKKLAKYHEKEEKIAMQLRKIEIWEVNKEGPKPRKTPGTNKERIEPPFPEVNGTGGLTRKDRLRLEHKTLGFYLTGHPLDDYDNLSQMAKYTISSLKEDEAKNKEKISIPIVISKINEISTRSGKQMANLIIEDKTGRQLVTVFPKTWTKMKGTIEEQTVCILHGRLDKISYESEIDEEGNSDKTVTIVNIIATTIKRVEEKEIKLNSINITLKDGSEWIFEPNTGQNLSRYKQALAYVNNMKIMG